MSEQMSKSERQTLIDDLFDGLQENEEIKSIEEAERAKLLTPRKRKMA